MRGVGGAGAPGADHEEEGRGGGRLDDLEAGVDEAVEDDGEGLARGRLPRRPGGDVQVT